MHCFGHIHEGYAAKVIRWEDGKVLGSESIESQGPLQNNAYPGSYKVSLQSGRETLMINAAIMDGTYKADNAPWLIDLELPRHREEG